MTPGYRIDLALLARYFDGTASTAERDEVLTWMGDDPARRAAVAELHAAWATDTRGLEAPYNVDSAWSRLAPEPGRLRASVSTPARTPRFQRLPRTHAWGLRAAAVFLLAAAGGTWVIASHRSLPARVAVQTEQMREYRTARGQRAVIRLLDGTEVALNVDSRIRIPASFGAGRRDLYLDGEAHFAVVHDTTRRFIVHTAFGVTEDVGTHFNVRAYPGDASERVSVAEGAVALAARPAAAPYHIAADTVRPPAEQRVLLRAGSAATVTRRKTITVDHHADVARESAWTEGRLELRGVSLADAARELARWYDLDVRITDASIAHRTVTGSYGDEPISQVLTVLTAAVGATYEWEGRTVTISAVN